MSIVAPGGVCVVGSIHMDVVATAARLPGKGESIIGHHMALSSGGKAGNQAAQAARNGVPAFMIGRVGQDDFGDRLRATLTSSGVDTTYLFADPEAATGISPVLTGADGEYASIIVPGAAWRLTATDLDAAHQAFSRSRVLLLQCEIPVELSLEAARLARSLGLTVIFNASPVPGDASAIPLEMWALVDVLLVNGTEATLLSGMPVTAVPEAMQAGEELRRRLSVPTVVVTLGGNGVVMLGATGTHHLPAWPVEVVETIGAGDAFAGALASELARGLSLEAALPFANAAGALAATRPGAHESLPTGGEIRAFLTDRCRAGA